MAEALPPGAAPPDRVRPHGRSLADFGELSPAEYALLVGSRNGTPTTISEERPEEETEANRVRADFVRFLALGGDAQAPVHERGIQLQGAWITGKLDLCVARLELRLALVHCTMSGIDAHQATIKYLNLIGTRLTSCLEAELLRCEGSLMLSNGFQASEIWLVGATIGGSLYCGGARIDNGSGGALNLQGARIDGAVMLTGQFHATGTVCLRDAVIQRGLDCSGGRFEGGDHGAIVADRATIGTVGLRNGFQASGKVCFNAARLGELDCSRGSFDSPGNYALTLDNARVDGVFFFRELAHLDGTVDLAGMRVATLCDDPESWEGARGQLVLDGFTYAGLGAAATDAEPESPGSSCR